MASGSYATMVLLMAADAKEPGGANHSVDSREFKALDFARVDEEWRTVPTDLGGWANRAAAMRHLAEKLATALADLAEGESAQ